MNVLSSNSSSFVSRYAVAYQCTSAIGLSVETTPERQHVLPRVGSQVLIPLAIRIQLVIPPRRNFSRSATRHIMEWARLVSSTASFREIASDSGGGLVFESVAVRMTRRYEKIRTASRRSQFDDLSLARLHSSYSVREVWIVPPESNHEVLLWVTTGKAIPPSCQPIHTLRKTLQDCRLDLSPFLKQVVKTQN